jgi:glycosyltransferase involved in cell wall biosynthesis
MLESPLSVPQGAHVRFSILMPAFNREAFLRPAIDSVLAQSFTDYELFVVDDGSTDSSAEIIRSYGTKVRFLQQSNLGPEAARNKAAALAQGEYLVWLDSDDYFLPFALEIYDQVIRYFDSPPFLLGNMFHKEAKDEIDPGQLKLEPIRALRYANFLARNEPVGTGVLIVRKSAFDEIGGLRKYTTAKTFHSDDNNLMLKLGMHSPFVYIERPRTAVYRLHAENSVRNLKAMADSIVRLADAERRGEYPGGQKTRTFIGRRAAAFAYGRCWQSGSYGLAVSLVARTAPMVAGAVWNSVRRKLIKGPRPIMVPFDSRAKSAHA